MVFENCGNAVTFYILTGNEKMISKSVVSPYKSGENSNVYLKQKEQKETGHTFGEILHSSDLSMVGPLNSTGQDIIHEYTRMSAKAKVLAASDDDREWYVKGLVL